MPTTPYVAGPAAIFVGLPRNAAFLIPPTLSQTTTLRPGALTGGVGTTLRPQLALNPALAFPPAPRGGRIGSERKIDPKDKNAILLLMRKVSPVLFGWCEDTPLVDFDPAYVPYYQEEMGRTHPAERIWDGEEGTVVADLTSFNEYVYTLLASHAANGLLALPGFPRGLDADGYIGTLMVTEGGALPLWVVLPYAGKPQYAAAGMPSCYRFFASVISPHGLGPLNTKARKLRVVWRTCRVKVPATGAILHYDHDPSGLPTGDA